MPGWVCLRSSRACARHDWLPLPGSPPTPHIPAGCAPTHVQWRPAVEGRLDELVAEQAQRQTQTAEPPRDKKAEVGLRLL